MILLSSIDAISGMKTANIPLAMMRSKVRVKKMMNI